MSRFLDGTIVSGGRPQVRADWIRWAYAVVCPNDEAIFDGRLPTCPCCAGESRMPLQTWLDTVTQ